MRANLDEAERRHEEYLLAVGHQLDTLQDTLQDSDLIGLPTVQEETTLAPTAEETVPSELTVATGSSSSTVLTGNSIALTDITTVPSELTVATGPLSGTVFTKVPPGLLVYETMNAAGDTEYLLGPDDLAPKITWTPGNDGNANGEDESGTSPGAYEEMVNAFDDISEGPITIPAPDAMDQEPTWNGMLFGELETIYVPGDNSLPSNKKRGHNLIEEQDLLIYELVDDDPDTSPEEVIDIPEWEDVYTAQKVKRTELRNQQWLSNRYLVDLQGR